MTRQAFHTERVVFWADSDPAAILSTASAFHVGVETVEKFYRAHFGISFRALMDDHRMGAPMVHASCDYLGYAREGDTLDLTLVVARAGRTSVTWTIEATNRTAGTPAFRMTLTSVFVDRETRRPVEIPAAFRTALQPFLAE